MLLGVVLCIGTFVRFWNLGGPGLHGDEETMAMAAMHIVQDGRPILPSGMFYPRGLSELYLMAASVRIFGESEWALRLPSALAGVATIYLCYVAGRRFLRPQWNIALAATVALLPEMIEYSQTARMYIFMLACVAGSLACLFAWERSGRIGWLIGGVLTLIVGIELHALAVTCALLFLMPGLLQGDQRKFVYGLGAVTVTMIAYLAIDTLGEWELSGAAAGVRGPGGGAGEAGRRAAQASPVHLRHRDLDRRRGHCVSGGAPRSARPSATARVRRHRVCSSRV